MPNVKELVSDITFTPEAEIDPSLIAFNTELGFMHMSAFADASNAPTLVLGFVDPRTLRGGTDQGLFRQPITEYADLPSDMQTVSAQGKGVGTRVYNVREAFGGSANRVPNIDVVAFRPLNLLDWRPQQSGRALQIARQAGKIIRVKTKLASVEKIAAEAQEQYGEAGAVLWNAPPHQELRNAKHDITFPDDVTPEFMIIRDARTRLHKIGETTSPW